MPPPVPVSLPAATRTLLFVETQLPVPFTVPQGSQTTIDTREGQSTTCVAFTLTVALSIVTNTLESLRFLLDLQHETLADGKMPSTISVLQTQL